MEKEWLMLLEEIRFMAELLIAEHLFASVFVKRKEAFRQRVAVGSACLLGISCLYPFFTGLYHRIDSRIMINAVNVGWYVFLVAGSVALLWFCYQATVSDAIFLGVAGYCLQHIEYVAVNEVLARGVWEGLTDRIPLYVIICIGTTAALYYVAYRIFRQRLSGDGGVLFADTAGNLAFTVLMFGLVFFATFMCQTIYVSGRWDYDQVNYLGAVTDFFICLLILWVQFAMCRIHSLNREKEIVEHLLYERKRQYALSRENIDTINHKCHDLKHQIRALKKVDAKERGEYIDELENAIDIYDAVVETGNEVLDTILSEKSLNCEHRHIRLSCIVDASHLDFMSTLDIYALLGNALDNAIENVSRYPDEEKRVISLTIKAVGDFLSIQTNNYCEERPKMTGDLPVSTKRDREYHGFGLKSMRHIAEKYGGSLAVSVENHVFTLQILLPMPEEFLRLYAMEKRNVK